jgi:antitoxin ChpS
MSLLTIRQSGGASIVSLPKAVLNSLELHVGSHLELSIEDHKIVLTPVVNKPTLEDLLAESPKKSFQVIDEDRAWLHMKPVGKEHKK